MTYQRLATALLRGEIYLGSALMANQCVPQRHAYLDALVGLVCDGPANAWKRPRSPVRLLEIGSWAGGSTITLASALQNRGCEGSVACIDRWLPYHDLSVNTLEPYKRMNDAAAHGDVYRLFQHNIAAAGIARLVEVRRGESHEVLKTLPPCTFDLVFIDASHLYDDVLGDIELSRPLLNDRGIICGDDLEVQAHEIDAETLARDLKSNADSAPFPGHPEALYHPGVTAAVSRVFGQVSSWYGLWAMQRSGEDWSPLAFASDFSPKTPQHLVDSYD